MANHGDRSPTRESYKSSPHSSPQSSAFAVVEPNYDEAGLSKRSFPKRFIDSFKRDPNARATRPGAVGADGRVFDPESAAEATANSQLQRKLKGRHLQMIAIGGSIGTGLFVGSGKALSNGGPASLLIAFTLVGIMLYCTVQALGEMAVLFPVSGSFSAYSTRFIDPAWGFAMGWNYALQWLIAFPLEIVAAAITVNYWDSPISPAAWVALFWVLIVSINFFGVKAYGEAEFVFSIIKVIAVVGFIILGIVLDIGGGPNGKYLGGKTWTNPGAFNNGFKGLCSVFVIASFAYAGTELVGLAAAETANPRKSLPTAVKQVFWRISLFYLLSLTIIGLIVPYTDKRLIGQSGSDANASPFVIAINDAGVQVLDSVMNVVIMIAVLSVGNSSVYGSSRTITALAEQHQAPKIFTYIDRKGRPVFSILLASAFGFLAFLAASSARDKAFIWMQALSGLSSIFTWGSICLAHIRFRKAWKLQGHSVDDLAFKSQAGLPGSWLGLIFNCLVLIAQFWVGFSPPPDPGSPPLSGAKALTENFFQAYLAVPFVLACYIPYKLRFRTPFMKCKDMDLKTGVRELNLAELKEQERLEQAAWPKWKKAYKIFC